MKHLQLDRPLIVFDLETTGTDPENDRIVEIAAVKILPDGTREARRRLIDPGRPIPPEASAVHGIRDEDVRGASPFRAIARSLLEFFGDGDLAGFNVVRFDVPLLERELRDCGLDLGVERRRIVDAMAIFHRMERRDLSAAVRFFLGREHAGAHGAEADVDAAAEVLDAELERYPDLPRTVEELDRWIRRVPAGAVDRAGRLVRDENGDVRLAFGQHRGRRLRDVARDERDYLEWLVDADFPEDAKEVVRLALRDASSATRGGRDFEEPPADQST